MFLQPAAASAATALEGAYAELEREAVAATEVGGGYASSTTRAAELRYSGQEYSLSVPGGVAVAPAELAERFHAEHERLYGFARRDVAVEFVKLAVSHIVRTGANGSASSRNGHRVPPAGTPSPARVREAWEAGGRRRLAVHDRAELASGTTFAGACVIEEPGATTYVPLGWTGAVDAHGNLLIDRTEETP